MDSQRTWSTSRTATADVADPPLVPVHHLSLLALCAERYALGRRTYIVGEVCSAIRKHLALIDRHTLEVMQRDIKQARDFGDPCDEQEWHDLYADITAVLNGL